MDEWTYLNPKEVQGGRGETFDFITLVGTSVQLQMKFAFKIKLFL